MKYRYFRYNDREYKVRTDIPNECQGNSRRVKGGAWRDSIMHLEDMLGLIKVGAEEFFPDTQEPSLLDLINTATQALAALEARVRVMEQRNSHTQNQ